MGGDSIELALFQVWVLFAWHAIEDRGAYYLGYECVHRRMLLKRHPAASRLWHPALNHLFPSVVILLICVRYHQHSSPAGLFCQHRWAQMATDHNIRSRRLNWVRFFIFANRCQRKNPNAQSGRVF